MEQFDPKTQALFRHKGYIIEKEMAHGAFGKVYKGLKQPVKKVGKTKDRRSLSRNTNSNGSEHSLPVAVKVINLEQVGDEYRARFLPRELEALISIHHPNAIAIYDIIRAGGKVFIFMEFAPNGDLADYVEKEGRLSESRVRTLSNTSLGLKSILRTQMSENISFSYKLIVQLNPFLLGSSQELSHYQRYR